MGVVKNRIPHDSTSFRTTACIPNRPQHASTRTTGWEAAANILVISSTTWVTTSSDGAEVSCEVLAREDVWAEGSGSVASGGGAECGWAWNQLLYY